MLEVVCDWSDHGASGGGWAPGGSEVDVRFVPEGKPPRTVLSQFTRLFISYP